MPCGDYAVEIGGCIAATVERKSLPDLVGSLISGRLRFALGELASVPRAAIVVGDRYSQIFTLARVRPAIVADGLAELQVRWPTVPLVFCETRKLAEEWTYRYLAAARIWVEEEPQIIERIRLGSEPPTEPQGRPDTAWEPGTAQVRIWARQQGHAVSDRGRLRPEIRKAWHDAHS